MILIASASYSPREFQLEFGKLPPTFLPLNSKRLYEYQAALFKGEKITISLPQSFEIPKFDKQKLKELNIDILKIPDGLSLGESIAFALNVSLPLNENLEILHGDTFLNNLEKRQNSLGVCYVENSYDWAFLAPNKKLNYKIKNQNLENIESLILSGYFNIEFPYEFLKNLALSNYDYLLALKMYSNKFPFFAIYQSDWLDFGLVSSYFHSKKLIATQRAFNHMTFNNGFIEKKSDLSLKIKAEIEWFKAIPNELSCFVPKILDKNESYEVEYLYLNTLAELFVFGNLSVHAWGVIFSRIKDFLTKLHKNTTRQNLNFNYKEKTDSRLNKFAQSCNIDLNKEWKFSDKLGESKLPSIKHILKNLEPFLDSSFNNVLIHGDFCFSNIMFDFRSNEIKCFDPRGLDFSDNISAYGDENYDLAKLTHSVLGLYDFIIAGYFEIDFKDYEIHFDIYENKKIKEIQDLFLEMFEIKANILALNIHLFLSMLPLHNDNKQRQNALLANALRLYRNFEREFL